MLPKKKPTRTQFRSKPADYYAGNKLPPKEWWTDKPPEQEFVEIPDRGLKLGNNCAPDSDDDTGVSDNEAPEYVDDGVEPDVHVGVHHLHDAQRRVHKGAQKGCAQGDHYGPGYFPSLAWNVDDGSRRDGL